MPPPDEDDPYVYPGTNVLRNRADLRDSEALTAYERLATADAILTLPDNIPLTPTGYRTVHHHLFRDVYDWAGKDRTVNIHRPGAPFCRVPFIASSLDKQFELLASQNNLHGRNPEDFAAAAAEHISELNAIHPFREGNGRTLRAFLEILGDQAGHPVDLTQISPGDWHDAAVAGFGKDYALMRTVITAAIGAMPTRPEIIMPRRRDRDPP